MDRKKIVVGISGGIDSAVTAALFKKEGYEVTGLHLVLDAEQENNAETIGRIGETLKINIVTRDVSQGFDEKIIGYFRSEHLKGNSPSPCAICNPTFKWKHLSDFADTLGVKPIASGHYINKVHWKNKWWLKKGMDPNKDQSYFLWGLGQSLLERIATPLGELQKERTKTLASELKLDFLQSQKESTGLCFAGNLSYDKLLTKHIKEADNIPDGRVLDENGKHIGNHKGYIYYTIGQKKEIDFFKKEGLCVTQINADDNTLIAGHPTSLWKTRFSIRDFKFVDINFALNCTELKALIRGFGWNPEGYARLHLRDNQIDVHLENPAWAPAPGQPAVFYYNNLVVGGGIIASV